MEIVGYFNVASIVIVIVMFAQSKRRQALRNLPVADRMNIVVCFPRSYRNLGIVVTAVCGGLFLLSLLGHVRDPENMTRLVISVTLAAFCAVGVYQAYRSSRWRVVVAEDDLVLTPVFGKGRQFSVRDVTHIRVDPTFGIRVYREEEKLFTVNRLSTGSAALVSYLIEKGVRVPDRINL
jgi:hypothetical protein